MDATGNGLSATWSASVCFCGQLTFVASFFTTSGYFSSHYVLMRLLILMYFTAHSMTVRPYQGFKLSMSYVQ